MIPSAPSLAVILLSEISLSLLAPPVDSHFDFSEVEYQFLCVFTVKTFWLLDLPYFGCLSCMPVVYNLTHYKLPGYNIILNQSVLEKLLLLLN